MAIPTEPIGSVPRPPDLVEGLEAFHAGRISREHSTRSRSAPSGTPSHASRRRGRRSSPTASRPGPASPRIRSTVSSVTDPIDPRVETAASVRERVLEAVELIPPDRLGTTDDCGFAPFADDRSTGRDTAFAKIRARVEGTALAARALGL